MDDHEIFYYSTIINKDNIFNILFNFLETDGRFRPLYWIHRVFSFYVFKSNFFLYYFEFFILGILTSTFLFFVLKKISKCYLSSIILLCFLFFGNLFTIFLGLGYGELLSLFLCSCCLFFMTLESKKYKLLNEILSFAFLVLCMCSKEQFLISVPFILLFKIIYDSKDDNIVNSIKNNLIYIFTSFVIWLICILFAYNLMGNDSSAPYIIDLRISYWFDLIKNLIKTDYLKLYIIEYISIIFIACLSFIINKDKSIKKYLIYTLIVTLFILENFIFINLTPNNGFQFRYLCPAVLGPVFLIAAFIGYFKLKNKLIYFLILIVTIIFSLLNLKYYSFSNINLMTGINIEFNKYLDKAKLNLTKEDNILLVASAINEMEFFESLTRYFNYYGYKNIYVYPYMEKNYDSLNDFEKNLWDFLEERFKNYSITDMKKNAKIIIVCGYDGEEKEHYKNETNINFKDLYKKINKTDLKTDFYIIK